MSESDPNRESLPVTPKPSGYRWFMPAAMASLVFMAAVSLGMILMFCKNYSEALDEYPNTVRSCIGIKPSQCPSLGEYHWIDWTRDAEVQWGAMPHSTYVLRTEVFDMVQFLHIDNGVIVGPIEEEEANRIEEELRKGSRDNKQ